MRSPLTSCALVAVLIVVTSTVAIPCDQYEATYDTTSEPCVVSWENGRFVEIVSSTGDSNSDCQTFTTRYTANLSTVCGGSTCTVSFWAQSGLAGTFQVGGITGANNCFALCHCTE